VHERSEYRKRRGRSGRGGHIGCITQLAPASAIPIVHPVELIDWATGGPVPEGLQRVANHAP